MNEEIKKEYEKLKATVKYHNDRYYNQDDPEISDYEYDQLSHKLRDMEAQWPELISEDSNSQRVGGEAKAESVKVTIPEMSSVDDIAKILEEKGVCTKSDFISEVQNGEFDYDFVKAIPDEKVYYRLEGYLFPDTYEFYVIPALEDDNELDTTEYAKKVLDTIYQNFNNKLTRRKCHAVQKKQYAEGTRNEKLHIRVLELI